MSLKQKLLKALYPVSMAASKGTMGTTILNEKKVAPKSPFYELKATANSGKEIDFLDLQGKKVLLVNTASDCGYTNQYEELERLHRQYHDKLAIIGFPANDFKEQEKGSDEDIAQFCQINYGVTFPIAKKGSVVKPGQQPVFHWLSNSDLNGWNNKQPQWNFCKYLVDEKGTLLGYFGPAVSPMDKAITGLL
jgi:glutathione peroxidase